MFKIIIYFTILLFLSCHTDSTRLPNAERISLTSKTLLKDSEVFMKYPYKIKVRDSLLFLWDLHGTEKFFHIYSYPLLKPILSFGNKGKGKNEFVNTGGFVTDKKKMYVFDSFRTDLYIYSIDSLLHASPNPLKIIHYPKECMPVLTFTKVEENFAILGFDGKNRIILVDSAGNILAKKFAYPADQTFTTSPYQNFLAPLWDSFLDYNPENKTLCIATKLGDVLEIYNLENSEEKIIVGAGGKPDIIQKNGGFSIGKINGFSDIQVTEKNIYALYSGWSREEKNIPEGGKYIHVYNLKGKLEKIYELDQYINGFDLHEDEKIIYAISSGEHTLSRYSIPSK